MTHRALRQCAPRFELNIPQRALQPMAVVTRDAMGATFAPTLNNNSTSNNSSRPSPRLCAGPTRVLPHLYLGGVGDAQSTPTLERIGIRRVLTVATDCDLPAGPTALADNYQRLAIQWRRVDLRDHSDEDITSHFEECLHFIRDGIRRGEPVLVHCRFGVSRSATIVMAYLMCYGMSETQPSVATYEEVFDFVKARRPEVSPNIGFVLALHALDEQQKKVCGALPKATRILGKAQREEEEEEATSSSDGEGVESASCGSNSDEEENQAALAVLSNSAAGPTVVCAAC